MKFHFTWSCTLEEDEPDRGGWIKKEVEDKFDTLMLECTEKEHNNTHLFLFSHLAFLYSLQNDSLVFYG